MSKKKSLTPVFWGVLLSVVVLLFAGCGQKSGQSQGESKKEILIGAVGAMTGQSAQLGGNLRQGVDLAVEEINAAGGINGRLLKVIYRDDEADPTKSLNAVQELITKEKVSAIIGPTNTTCALAVQPFISQSKIPHINGGCTGTELVDPQKYPFSFRTILNNRDQAEAMVNYAVNERGWKRVAIVHDTTALGVGGAADLKYFLNKLGISPVAEVTYTVGEQDMTAQALALKEARPDVALFWTLGVDGARLAKAMQKIDYLPPKLNVLGYTGLGLKALRDLAGDAAKDFMCINAASFVYTPGKPLPERISKFLDALDKKYGTQRDTMPYPTATHYDGVKLLAEAMKKAGPDNPEKIKEALEGISNFEGVADTYSFSPTDHDGSSPESTRVVWAARELVQWCFEGVPAK